MKTIHTLPFRKAVAEEVAKVRNAVKYANYSGFFAVFVYANIAIYFAWAVHKIWY